MSDFLAIGNDELDNAPPLGETVCCWICGESHPVEYRTDSKGNESRLLGFFRCKDHSYLCGVAGREVRPRAK